MSTFFSTALRFVREEDAPTMVEYGILIAAIALIVGMSTQMFGQVCAEVFRDASVVTNFR